MKCEAIQFNLLLLVLHLSQTIAALYHYIKSRKKWFKSKISYYSNSSSTFNFLELSVLLSGDVHPLPGPENRKSISVRISQRTRRRHGNHHTVKNNHKRPEVRTIINIPTISEQSPNVKNHLRLCCLNARSIKNKSADFVCYAASTTLPPSTAALLIKIGIDAKKITVVSVDLSNFLNGLCVMVQIA